ncbi:uncharacterized protein LOC143264867 [Megachile rotundata]|uniref:uncharacterized protein LOC143264867 n=1 Tax=Megachile rotundata TaxID=143995 RepID=UPI003FD2273F
MGSWQLEVGRMMMYILFPIGIYYYFNQTENIEQWIINEKKKYRTTSKKHYEEFLEFIDNCNSKKQKKQIEEMEAKYKMNS